MFTRMANFTPVAMKVIGITAVRAPDWEGKFNWISNGSLAWAFYSLSILGTSTSLGLTRVWATAITCTLSRKW
jgi:hypothetical protein